MQDENPYELEDKTRESVARRLMGVVVGIAVKSIGASPRDSFGGRRLRRQSLGSGLRDAPGAVGDPDESRFWRPGRIVRVGTPGAFGDFRVIPRF